MFMALSIIPSGLPCVLVVFNPKVTNWSPLPWWPVVVTNLSTILNCPLACPWLAAQPIWVGHTRQTAGYTLCAASCRLNIPCPAGLGRVSLPPVTAHWTPRYPLLPPTSPPLSLSWVTSHSSVVLQTDQGSPSQWSFSDPVVDSTRDHNTSPELSHQWWSSGLFCTRGHLSQVSGGLTK